MAPGYGHLVSGTIPVLSHGTIHVLSHGFLKIVKMLEEKQDEPEFCLNIAKYNPTWTKVGNIG